ncbi:MAG: hypothetical protein H6702_10365 [Myxococcales bacterium]|nr:hypothetical protein [Myxococcales bacterium]
MSGSIDLRGDARASHAAHFAGYLDPRAGLTAPVRVGPLLRAAKANGVGVYALCTWAAAHAANQVPALRRRLRGPQAAHEHVVVHPSVTVLTPADTFMHCHLPYDPDWRAFCAAAAPALAAAKALRDLPPPVPDDARLFCTGIPWVAFTQVKHPVAGDASDSVPRIAWGRIGADGSMPLNIEAHHALVDGLHLGRFFQAWQAAVDGLPG